MTRRADSGVQERMASAAIAIVDRNDHGTATPERASTAADCVDYSTGMRTVSGS
jgi:hypothetical protein